MPDTRRLRPNSPPIIEETIDQETIMVNLEVGTYYSLAPLATYMWGAMARGASVAQISEAVSRESGADGDQVGPEASTFFDELIAEELVVVREEETPATGEHEWPAGLTYEPPVLNRYTDMQELLLLDPVHDVGAAGWPEPR
jgi:Coenzyme PQQ synthesis protein D (PqqD)